jgi:hypothetical protein
MLLWQIIGNSFERKLAILKGNSRDSTPNGHKSSSIISNGRRRSSSPLPRSAGSDYSQSRNRIFSSPTPVAKKLFEGSPANDSTGNNNPFYQLMMWNLELIWFDLFELINWHKHLWDCLGELRETSYDMSIISCYILFS